MQGVILDYSIQTNSGLISGDDNNRYTFSGADWRASVPPSKGTRVDFNNTNSGVATDIYTIQSNNQPSSAYQNTLTPTGTKSKLAAGLIALLIGGLGIHKFYLGRPIQGVIYLLFCWTFIPSIIAFIEGIIYLCTSDEEFAKKYG